MDTRIVALPARSQELRSGCDGTLKKQQQQRGHLDMCLFGSMARQTLLPGIAGMFF